MRGRGRRARGLAAVAVVAIGLLAGGAPAVGATDHLPDLGMARLRDFQVDTQTISGHRLLRYTAIIVNVGAGPFELRGQRPDTSTPDMSVVQRVYDDSSQGYHDVSVPATMYYAGDGHNHWHVRDLETGTLTRLDNGSRVGTLAKHGFCFSDNTQHNLSLPGAPQTSVYRSCGTSTALAVTMGLSVGWGDTYTAGTNYQWVDVTGLADGHYRLTAAVNAGPLGLQESDGTNDATWVELALHRHSVKVLSYGPAS